MEVNLSSPNPALESVFSDPNQIITLDANFLIPPDRSRLTRKGFDFSKFQHIWLDPIFKAFPNLAIHEAVYDELVLPSVRSYAQAMLESTGLDNIRAIKMYELIFYLHVIRLSERQSLKLLYKYQYYLTNHEKRSNPEWGQFLTEMESMYHFSPADRE